MTGVLVARRLEGGVRFALGSTMAFRRSDLAAIGGFGSFVDYLADDYELGKRIVALGREVVVSEEIVDTFLPAYTLRNSLSTNCAGREAYAMPALAATSGCSSLSHGNGRCSQFWRPMALLWPGACSFPLWSCDLWLRGRSDGRLSETARCVAFFFWFLFATLWPWRSGSPVLRATRSPGAGTDLL